MPKLLITQELAMENAIKSALEFLLRNGEPLDLRIHYKNKEEIGSDIEMLENVSEFETGFLRVAFTGTDLENGSKYTVKRNIGAIDYIEVEL